MNQAEASSIAARLAKAGIGVAVPPLPTKGGTNWVTRTGGLPDHLDDVARHIFWIGMRGDLSRESEAIASAVNWCKHVCDTGETITGQKVHPDIRAKNCAAVASWESKRAAAHAEHAATAGAK